MSLSSPAPSAAGLWFLRGASHLVSIPAAVLVAAMFGFGALARDAGYSMAEAILLTVAVWALPSQLVYIAMVGSGASMAAVILAVALSGMRFLPMVMAWTPVVRGPRTTRIALLALSWFVAVTSWVFAMARLPQLPRPARLPYFAGFGAALAASSAVAIALSYTVVDGLPGWASAALVFLTPVYFLLALWGAARLPADRLALLAGLVLGPVFALTVPAAGILLAGLVGGTLAYAGQRVLGRRT